MQNIIVIGNICSLFDSMPQIVFIIFKLIFLFRLKFKKRN